MLEMVEKTFSDRTKYALQAETQLGTGHAVLQAESYLVIKMV